LCGGRGRRCLASGGRGRRCLAGAHGGRSPLSRRCRFRSDFAGKIGLEPAPQNSLRALRPLRSTTCGESETNALRAPAPGRFFQPPFKSPPPDTACRERTRRACSTCDARPSRPLLAPCVYATGRRSGPWLTGFNQTRERTRRNARCGPQGERNVVHHRSRTQQRARRGRRCPVGAILRGG
jgi:hypothetical protein